MKANFRNTAALLCSLSVFLVCVFMSYSFYVKANEIKTWPKATATVISSGVSKFCAISRVLNLRENGD